MSEAVDNITLDIHHRLYQSQFRCLGSFLCALMEATGADGAGVVSIYNRKLTPRRTVGEDFEKIQLYIENELIRPEPNFNLSRAERETHKRSSAQTSLGEWTKEGKYLMLRRIWPAASWVFRSGERAWLYINGPKFVIPPKDCANLEVTDQLGGLMSAFIRWKNEQLARHDEIMRSPISDTVKVLNEIKRTVVRPVLPTHFYNLLVRFKPQSDNALDWTSNIEELLGICKRSSNCECLKIAKCTSLKCMSCPQTDEMDSVMQTLADLDLWRTGFWNKSKHPEVSADHRFALMDKALRGLLSASDILLKENKWFGELGVEPIDFQNGAVGLSGERALLRYFCAIGIKMAFERNVSLWKDSASHASDLEFPAKFANLAATLLGEGRWTAEAIDNLLDVVALFGHRVLGIPERIDLVRHLRQTLRGESALHTLKARYRDHFFHTLEVCFLGFVILTSCPYNDGMTFLNHLVKMSLSAGAISELQVSRGTTFKVDDFSSQEADLLAQWWTAALVHDTAYGIDIFDGTLRLLDFFSGKKEVGEFIASARGSVSKMAEPLQKLLPELADDNSLKKGDHGVIAAASLSSILNSIGPETAKRFLPAVRAIAFHNTRHPQINAGQDPIAALLVLCDTVQEWGRSSLGFSRSPSVLLSRLMEASLTPPEEQFGPVKRYGISLEASKNGMTGDYYWKEPGTLTIDLDYGAEALTECRAKFTWADFTYNLQRVDFRPWGLEFRIKISVPYPDSPIKDKPVKSQFEHFGDFIEEQEVRFIERWFNIARLQDPKRAVAYRLVDDGKRKKEEIQFNLCELSKEFVDESPLMGGKVGDFGASIMRWSVYAREQAESPPAQVPPV